MDTSLRSMIRDVLAEEIGKAKAQGLLPAATGAAPKPKVREETVSIRSDGELSAFVARLADILKDARSREEIEKGRWVFHLGTANGGPGTGLSQAVASLATSPAAPVPTAARIDTGIVSERQIEALPPGTTRLIVGKPVRFTPLAKDRLRLRGITLERIG